MIKNKIEEYLKLILLLGAFASPLSAALPDGKSHTPLNDNFLPNQVMETYGFEKSVIAFSTAPKQVATVAGVLNEVEISTGATTNFVVCMDTTTLAVNLTLADFITAGDGQASRVVAPPLFANVTNADSLGSKLRFKPVQYTNLVCITSVGTLNTAVIKIHQGRD